MPLLKFVGLDCFTYFAAHRSQFFGFQLRNQIRQVPASVPLNKRIPAKSKSTATIWLSGLILSMENDAGSKIR